MGFDNIHTATDKLTAANSAPTITELKNITQAELTKISTQANAEKTLINAKIAVAKDIIENHTKYSLEDTQSAEMELGSAQAFLNVITTFENALSTYKKNHQAEVAATKHTASTATNALSLTLDEEIQVALEPINKFVKDANAIKTESYATYEPKNTTEPNASKIQVAVNNQASKSARVAHRPVTKKILNAGSAVATTPKQAEVKLVEVTKSANEIKFEENNKKYQELLQEQVLQ